VDQEDVIRTFEDERRRAQQRVLWIGGGVVVLVVLLVGLNWWAGYQATRPRTDDELRSAAEALIDKRDATGLDALLEKELFRTRRVDSSFEPILKRAAAELGMATVEPMFERLASAATAFGDPLLAEDMGKLVLAAGEAQVLGLTPEEFTSTTAGVAYKWISDGVKIVPEKVRSDSMKAEAAWADAEAGLSPESPSTMPDADDAKGFWARVKQKGGATDDVSVKAEDLKLALASVAVCHLELDRSDLKRAQEFADRAKELDSTSKLTSGLPGFVSGQVAKAAQSVGDELEKEIKGLFASSTLDEPTFWRTLAGHTAPDFTGTSGGQPFSASYDLAKLGSSDYPSGVTATATVSQNDAKATLIGSEVTGAEQDLAVRFQIPGSDTFESYTFHLHWAKRGGSYVVTRIDTRVLQSDPKANGGSTSQSNGP
jgi:hypothetical protein